MTMVLSSYHVISAVLNNASPFATEADSVHSFNDPGETEMKGE